MDCNGNRIANVLSKFRSATYCARDGYTLITWHSHVQHVDMLRVKGYAKACRVQDYFLFLVVWIVFLRMKIRAMQPDHYMKYKDKIFSCVLVAA